MKLRANDLEDNFLLLEFTPLEFETRDHSHAVKKDYKLEFTPLEFETKISTQPITKFGLEFTPLEFETTAGAKFTHVWRKD